MTNEDQAREQIRFELRQGDGGALPLRYRPSVAVAALVSNERAEAIFEEEVARLEAVSGLKFDRIDLGN